MADQPAEPKWVGRPEATAAEVIIDFWGKDRDFTPGAPCSDEECLGFTCVVGGWSACLRCGRVEHRE